MKKVNVTYLEDDDYDLNDDLPPEIDFSKVEFIRPGPKRDAVFVRLDPDLSDFFKTSDTINETLRRVMREMQKRRVSFKKGREKMICSTEIEKLTEKLAKIKMAAMAAINLLF
jgi:hypothetical protein